MKRFAWIIGVLMTSVAMGQMTPTTRPLDSPDVAAVRKQLIELWTAIGASDIEKAKSFIDVTKTETVSLIENLIAFGKANKHFKTATAKFGEDAKNAMGGDDFNAEVMAERTGKQVIVVEGDHAKVQGEGFSLQRKDGVWKLVTFTDDPRSAQLIGRMLPMAAKVLNEVATEIEAGKYATVDEMNTGMKAKIRTEMERLTMEMMNTPTTAPSSATTRPTN
jgi:hypothetical protein